MLTDQNTVLSSQTYTYDAQDRVSGTEMETIGREISYAYDGLNRLTSATGGIGGSNTVSTAYTYETNNGSQTGRLGSVSYNKTINGVTTQLYPTISYDYDANGNITKVYENGVKKNHYVYDSLSRLIVDDNARDNYTYVYIMTPAAICFRRISIITACPLIRITVGTPSVMPTMTRRGRTARPLTEANPSSMTPTAIRPPIAATR